MKQKNILIYGSLILAMIGWSLSFVWFKVALPIYGPLTIVFFRLVISSVLLFVVLKLRKEFVIPSKSEWKLLLLMAFFEPFLYFLGESFGLQYISSTLAAVIIATVPLFVVIPARIFHNERPSGNFFMGAAVSLLGVGFVAYHKGLNVSFIGVGLEFLAVFAAVGYSTMLKKIPDSVSILSIIFYQSFIGAIYFSPLWLIFEAQQTLSTPLHFDALIAIFELAVVASVLAFALFTYSVRQIGITRSNVFINAIPGFTAIFAWIVLGEPLSMSKVIGLFLLFIGLWLAQRAKFSVFGK